MGAWISLDVKLHVSLSSTIPWDWCRDLFLPIRKFDLEEKASKLTEISEHFGCNKNKWEQWLLAWVFLFLIFTVEEILLPFLYIKKLKLRAMMWLANGRGWKNLCMGHSDFEAGTPGHFLVSCHLCVHAVWEEASPLSYKQNQGQARVGAKFIQAEHA